MTEDYAGHIKEMVDDEAVHQRIMDLLNFAAFEMYEFSGQDSSVSAEEYNSGATEKIEKLLADLKLSEKMTIFELLHSLATSISSGLATIQRACVAGYVLGSAGFETGATPQGLWEAADGLIKADTTITQMLGWVTTMNNAIAEAESDGGESDDRGDLQA